MCPGVHLENHSSIEPPSPPSHRASHLNKSSSPFKRAAQSSPSPCAVCHGAHCGPPCCLQVGEQQVGRPAAGGDVAGILAAAQRSSQHSSATAAQRRRARQPGRVCTCRHPSPPSPPACCCTRQQHSGCETAWQHTCSRPSPWCWAAHLHLPSAPPPNTTTGDADWLLQAAERGDDDGPAVLPRSAKAPRGPVSCARPAQPGGHTGQVPG
jgi:hypothetical protein